MDFEECFYSAKRRYYDACSEINGCQSRLYEFEKDRRNTVSRINQLKADIRNAQAALSEMVQVLKSEEPLNRKLGAVSDKTGEAAVNFSAMVAASDIVSRDLTDVYGEEASNTKAELENIFDMLKQRKKGLESRLEELQNSLNGAMIELEDTDAGIRAAKSNLRELERIRRSAAIDMEYYGH